MRAAAVQAWCGIVPSAGRRCYHRPVAAPALREIHSAEEVRARIDELAERLSGDYPDELPLFVGIAEGARNFTDLVVAALERRGRSVDVAWVRARRTHGTELGEVEVEPLQGTAPGERSVLLLDDIADEGRTLEAVCERLRRERVRSVRIAVLVSKHERRRVHVPLDYVGFEVPAGWVVGVGMDLDGDYRDLDALAVVVPDEANA